MSKTPLRIDWFDGTVIEEPRSSSSQTNFEDEESPELPVRPTPHYQEKKLMGFKRLLDLSQQDANSLMLQLSGRSSFWDLINTDMKDDYKVLITKILSKLYSVLQSGQKSFMISKLLETKFLTSKFLDILKDYLVNLPNVKISEKRMNMQFWEDLEPFYYSVLAVCDGIVYFKKELCYKIIDIIEAVRLSVIGVIEEHRETFSNELFDKLDELEHKVQEHINKIKTSNKNNEQIYNNIFNYRTIDIFPKKQDLIGAEPVDIKPNIVNGAYSSVEHYLDIQFKLLREDFIGPLREAICKYKENPNKRKYENIRVLPKVRVIRSYVSNNRVGHLIDIAWSERLSHTNIDGRKLAHNKHLMFGSLLLFTSDNFETVLCATVLDSSFNLLNDGYVAVTFHNPISKNIFSEPYLMIESEIFFEPYHRVLKVLQNMEPVEMPMKSYIVDVQPKTNSPTYLTQNSEYNIPNKNKEISFPVLDTEKWPSNDYFGLDSSQMEAYKLALTREFAVIQGPPGTGKTFIGVKVAQTLLQNLSLVGNPMLVICYTNHALDQFLEGIMTVTDNIVRLGSQSKNVKIEPYTLSTLRYKSKSRFGYLYASKRSEQEKIFMEMMEVQTEIEKCEKEVLSYDSVQRFLKVKEDNVILYSLKDDPILEWLFDDVERNGNNIVSKNDVVDDWEKEAEDLDQTNDCEVNIEYFSNNIVIENKLESCFSEQIALKEIDSMNNSIKYVKDVTQEESEADQILNKFKSEIHKINNRLENYKKYFKLYQNGKLLRSKLTSEQDAYKYPEEVRWRIYFDAVELIKDQLILQMNHLQEKHFITGVELDEIATLVDTEVVKNCRVVGVTTTAAARRHDLLHNLTSSIVIVEEAAEVLEAHIVASLTQHCQHVILIGDHKQLRPSAAHYKLAKNFNLEISLFERMIRNGVHARALTTQRRMRPEFVKLIVPAIYIDLDTHESVYEYDDVRGNDKNLFFLDHEVLEDGDTDDGWSHKNSYEAKWCVALADYLRKHKYQAEDITILATYTSQATLIREISKKYTNLHNVRITVVDNFQGEESRIVILSLVRSNKDGKIGFLSAHNRVCVALSRAKEGFYILGNMGLLKSSSRLWNNINEHLVKQNAIGRSFKIVCDIHKDNTTEVQNPDELMNSKTESCLKICKKKNCSTS